MAGIRVERKYLQILFQKYFKKEKFIFMKKVLFVIMALVITHFTAHAQIEGKVKKIEKTVLKKGDEWSGWKKGGEGLINVSYTAFSQWAEGGINTGNLVGNLALFADYRKGRWLWENDGKFGLGFTHTTADGFRKADDVIDLQSKLGYKLSEKAYWATLGTFASQFLEGETFQEDKNSIDVNPNDGVDSTLLTKTRLGISQFMAPARVTLGTGIDYKPQEFLSIYFSPLTFKGVIVMDEEIADLGIHGNEGADLDANGNRIAGTGQKFKPELGANLKIGIKRDLVKNVTLTSAADFYSNFLKNIYGENKPQNIDVIWVTNLAMKVNKFISATVEYTFKYDDEVGVPKIGANDEIYQGKGAQTKSFFGVGFSYKFGEN